MELIPFPGLCEKPDLNPPVEFPLNRPLPAPRHADDLPQIKRLVRSGKENGKQGSLRLSEQDGG